ncbi:cytochrome d ubiquinol oxidase subunit II [Pseudomonas kermanshahensis]|jgi:cytochrome d ubiquinol oxidase subunit II|uniref:Cytochrome d ubiquinol oxidase subunit II n=1 Tax=Pseudomonas kermanshahensis TaxID=2745482 RepID=A0ABU8RDD1_9PSED|nr:MULTISPECIES: cytochrome d ubiquinol oxidase subunit II [Pseudomonas]ATP46789.1 cytochrome d ubiquinol oxidase subunit II [Pseudomonas putida]ATP52027.1 cytochrome d ubiquinol oxidase subunit II [Pseudomonas putida]MBC3485435.1 cytochrome d ubiquinol oxidase subunit II [Pseudomonas sp. SWRI50]MBC3494858.1 cytochrome d ubiquinol oxidase subunit II [Pseudomonas sp. SWRI67]MBV4528713.1 cytochrome d ubiquinol oxidase subunit II [Pseudomonas kermanshahensis]
MGIDLPLIWAVIIIFGVMMYVVMDGFDLGIGMLFPFVKGERDRDVMMNTVAPVWDGNETWLVLGGAGLFGAFPMAYSVVLEALYLPLILMLIGLIFRGVAFEFRFKAKDDKRHIWDKAFIWGSLIATFFQGVALGAFIEGFKVVDRHYAGGTLDWLTPFSVFSGLGLIVAYTLLGCTWLIMKTEGPLQLQMHDLAKPLALVLLVVIGIVSLWTPIAYPQIADRWFSMPNLIWFMPVPILVLVTFYGLLKAVARNANYTPFLLTLVLIFLGYSGLGISVWPNIIPPSISIWDAAAPPQSQGFMLVGTLFILPFILGYTFWSYYVFRGKVTHEDGYH